MTIVEMISLFDLIVDKVGDPFWDEDEKLEFFNTAQMEVLERYMFPWKYKDPQTPPANQADPAIGLENNEFITNYVSGLIVPIQVASDVDGKVLKAALDAAVITETYHINSAALNDRPVVFRRHNDRVKLKSPPMSSTKGPTVLHPTRTHYDDHILIEPSSNDTVDFDVTRYPLDMAVSPQQDSELPNETHNDIIFRALTLAGISIREDVFYQMAKNEYNTEV